MSEIKKGALQSPANTARTTGTIVRHVQAVDTTGKVTPAGEAVGNAPFVKVTDGTDTLDVIVQNAAFGTASKGLPLYGKYESSPTTYDNGDAVPLCVDANGKVILSAIDVEIGAVELKNAATDDRAQITDANTARANTDHVLQVQQLDATGKVPPAGDAVGNAPFVKVTDGTTGAVVETDGNKKALNVNITDGTNDMPTMDAAARLGYVGVTDGTNLADVLADSADGMATTVDSLVTSSVLMGYDAKATNFNLLRAKANGILQTLNAMQIPGSSIYIVGLHKGTYTVNNGTWPIDYTGFTGLTKENLPFGIINLTTDEVYNCSNATISSTQITPDSTFNTGCTAPATGDLLFIPIVQSVRAYDDAGDYLKVSNLDPDRNQILNNTQHSAITTATNGTGVYVADMRAVSCCVVASSITSGGVITVKGSPDNTNFATVATVGSDGIIRTTQTISANGTTYYKIVNCDPMYLRADLTTRTDGTYTIYLQGRA